MTFLGMLNYVHVSTNVPMNIYLISIVLIFFLSLRRSYSHSANVDPTHSARVVHSTSYSDVTLRGRPNLGPNESFPDVLLRPSVRRT